MEKIKSNLMSKKILDKAKKTKYIKCRKCGDEIFWNTHKKFIECKCKAIYVDGCDSYVRIGGDRQNYEEIFK